MSIHNYLYNKILKSDWLSVVLIAALIGQYTPLHASLKWHFFSLLAKFPVF